MKIDAVFYFFFTNAALRQISSNVMITVKIEEDYAVIVNSCNSGDVHDIA